jgi:chitin synthase
MYLMGIIVYSVIMFYTIFCTLYLVVLELMSRAGIDSGKEITVSGTLMMNIVLSMLSTVGLYFYTSFLYLDPWHMFTSSIQYFLLMPSYICTLQVYAFCNTHDVTWGTKGDNVINTDLGTAKVINGSTVVVEMPSEQLDIDSGYDAALRNLRDRLEVPEPPLSDSQMQEDYYRAVRTYMVSIWMVANLILAMSVSEVYGVDSGGTNIYLAIILWSVAVLAAIRAVGSTAYALLHLIHKIVEGKTKFQAGNISNFAPSSFGGSSVGGSSEGGSSKPNPIRYSGGPSMKDRLSEAKWAVSRGAGKMMFWRK